MCTPLRGSCATESGFAMQKDTRVKSETTLESLGRPLEVLGEFEIKIQGYLDRLDYLPAEAYDFRESARMKLENLLESALDCGGATRAMRAEAARIENDLVRWEKP